jgi:alkanesulfonate monooxygenase SsuD/methylene tetrahydromethanopterin reductase-like flavin-dependent oxidoreductase (luciferase family)
MPTAPARVPLSVLDLSPFSSGSTSRDGLRNSIDLAQEAEASGYSRYWLAEHHFNPGVAGAAPPVLLAAIAAATTSIRVGTAATILGNTPPAQIAELLGTVAALHPGRVDIGLGRSGAPSAGRRDAAPPVSRVVDGLVVPAPPTLTWFGSARQRAQSRLLGRSIDEPDTFATDVADILAFFAGDYTADEGVPVHVTPAEGQEIELWIHGSSAGPSSRLAGALGLPFGANYHVAPYFVLEAIELYRSSFVPSARLPEPRVIVSVDVVVADDDAAAEELAAGYPEWVLSARDGDGAIPFPTAEEARSRPLSPEQLLRVKDRVDTQFRGSPSTVVERLETLQRVTGADELLVTTITHDHADRVNSYRLLADAWLAS